MSRKQGRPRKAESHRRWRIPPPLLRDAGDPGPEGLQILEEIPDDLGGLLWKTVRSVLLWAEVAPSDRKELFEAGAAERRQAEILAAVPQGEEELVPILETLTLVLSLPAQTDADTVGAACRRVAAWAQDRGHPRTALEFLQAGALVCPADPAFALAIVRAARDLAQYSRAEAWFFRAVGLARQCRDWDTYVRAYLAHGKMMVRRGSFPAARRSVLKALRRSNRQGLTETRAMALHELFVIADCTGDAQAAQAHALEALRSYGPSHPRLPLLAHDLAFFWLQQGRFADSFQAVREVVPLIPPHLRPIALGTLARAAGGSGEKEAFRSANDKLTRAPAGPGVAEAWLEVARGALQLGELEEAEASVHRAEHLARERHEGRVRLMAESVRDAIRAEARARAAREVSRPAAPVAAPSPESLEVVRILRERVVGASALA
jgi:tetratricopeptide (TPR) repeat protein